MNEERENETYAQNIRQLQLQQYTNALNFEAGE